MKEMWMQLYQTKHLINVHKVKLK